MQLSIYLGVYATIYISMCEEPSRMNVCIFYMYASWYVGVYATIYISMCEDPSRMNVCILYMYASWHVGVYATMYISVCEDPSQRSTLCCFVLQQRMLFVAASCTHAPCVALCCSNVCCLLQCLLIISKIFTATASAVPAHSLKCYGVATVSRID